MVTIIKGCNFVLQFAANELTSSNYYNYTFPTGYSINIMHVTGVVNIDSLCGAHIKNDIRIVFPVINSKSPSSILLYINDITKDAEIRFTIEKFGQIPDPNYFNKAFDPILVTGDDGNKYNVIPSDQFK